MFLNLNFNLHFSFYFKRIKMAMASKIKITPTVINKMFKILARPRSDSGKILLTVVEVEVGKLDEEVVVCVLVLVPSSVVFAVPVATLSTV